MIEPCLQALAAWGKSSKDTSQTWPVVWDSRLTACLPTNPMLPPTHLIRARCGRRHAGATLERPDQTPPPASPSEPVTPVTTRGAYHSKAHGWMSPVTSARRANDASRQRVSHRSPETRHLRGSNNNEQRIKVSEEHSHRGTPNFAPMLYFSPLLSALRSLPDCVAHFLSSPLRAPTEASARAPTERSQHKIRTPRSVPRPTTSYIEIQTMSRRNRCPAIARRLPRPTRPLATRRGPLRPPASA